MMLSLKPSKDDKKSRIVALINPSKDKDSKQRFNEIYLVEDDEDLEPIETTDANKRKIFRQFLDLNKKLRLSDIDTLVKAYDKSEIPPNRLERVMTDGLKFLEQSLRSYIDYGKTTELFPVVEFTKEPSYRMFISGLSGSGKSTFISQFIKFNPPKKEGKVFLFSPISDDPSLKNIKKLIQINLHDFEKEVGRSVEIDDFPENSICLFDDVETFKKGVKEPYLELRDMLLERGRHLGVSTITVSHNPCGGNLTKASLRESQYFLLFPSTNKMDCQKVLKIYGGLDNREIQQILNQKSRWCFFKKSVPRYAVFEHSVIAF